MTLTSTELAPLHAGVRLLSIRAIKGGHAVITSEVKDFSAIDLGPVELFHDEPTTLPFIDGGVADALRVLGVGGSSVITLRQRGIYTMRLYVGDAKVFAYMDVCFEWQEGHRPRPRICHASDSPAGAVAEAMRTYRS